MPEPMAPLSADLSDPAGPAGAEADGRPVVWLHGAGQGPDYWDPARARGLCLALPGHADRPRADTPSVEAMAQALIPDLPAGRFDLIGHSLGGQVAMEIAATLPDRIRRLVLVDTAISTHRTILTRAFSALTRALVDRLPRRGLIRFASARQQAAARAKLEDGLRRMKRAALSDAVRAATTYDGADRLPRITAPTLVIVGRDNRITHAQGREMARTIAQARFLILPGGHLLNIDDPDSFHSAVAEFLAEGP